MKQTFKALGNLSWEGRACAFFVLCAATAIRLSGQTLTTLHSFAGTRDGSGPPAGLVQATNGDLYGTTTTGGPNGSGTIFKITAEGTLTTLYSFFCDHLGACPDGQTPSAGLVQATNGDFYGTTELYPYGTVFKVTPSGTLNTLYQFCSQSECSDGDTPLGGLVQATNGDIYGTTIGGGVIGEGTVFKMTPNGQLTTIYSFCSQADCTDGWNPAAGLIQIANGDLYGTTSLGGGPCDCGTVFKITPTGSLTTIYRFCLQSGCPDGEEPYGGLVQATNGDLYGITENGGANANSGTVFKITPGGTLTTLYSFCSQPECTDGELPYGGLVQATDGNLYGTTVLGGAYGQPYDKQGGTVFKITPKGELTTLYSFCSQPECTDGSEPTAALIQDTNGNLYGTTFGGGAAGLGTIFSLSVGLGPFVETQTKSGAVGSTVKILGTDLNGASSVTFNGTSALFTVSSSGTEITATVPAGATTGTVKVVTLNGTLSSNVPFRVP
jgi:uncharacterized repeat protein (TIGR03803 family)